MSATMQISGYQSPPPSDRRVRNRWFRKHLRFAGSLGVNLCCGGRGWYQEDDWWDEAEQRRKKERGDIVWIAGWQPSKMPRKYMRGNK